MWKAKNSSLGGSSAAIESQPIKVVADVLPPPDACPGKSFRNFRFDTAPIFQAIDAAFST